jgi:hypothetical protein
MLMRDSVGERVMRDPLSKAERKADHYRKEAVRYHELAKFARPEYLGDFYRRIAVRYLFMAEDVTKWAERQPEALPTQRG